jgi:lyso-ornithine lipid O-acyltransferase
MDAVADAPAPIEALRPRRLRRRKPLRFRSRLPGGRLFDVFADRPLGGRVRAARRLALLTLWTLVSLPVQAVLLLLPGKAKIRFPLLYHSVLSRLIGLRVQVIGRPCPDGPVLFVSNHSSWLDIPVLGGVLPAVFVAKSEVGTWPVIRTIARLGRTVFVSRSRGTTGREAQAMRDHMTGGGSLILFPEGTSNDGTRELPFRTSFFAIADGARQVQPVSVVYDRLGGLPACRRDRPLFAWYGDMEIASHFWQLARRSGARVTVVLHEPFPPGRLPNRKALAAETQRIVREGAERLRQNRPVVPIAPPAAPAGEARGEAAGP